MARSLSEAVAGRLDVFAGPGLKIDVLILSLLFYLSFTALKWIGAHTVDDSSSARSVHFGALVCSRAATPSLGTPWSRREEARVPELLFPVPGPAAPGTHSSALPLCSFPRCEFAFGGVIEYVSFETGFFHFA